MRGRKGISKKHRQTRSTLGALGGIAIRGLIPNWEEEKVRPDNFT